MKRILSLLLCAAILFAVPMNFIPSVEAANDAKVVLSFDKASDVSVLKHVWNKTYMTEADADSTDTKISNYAAVWNTAPGPYFNWGDLDLDITGYNYIHFWVHSSHEFSVYSTMSHPGSSTSKATFLSSKPGWNLISAKLRYDGSTHHHYGLPLTETKINSIGFQTDYNSIIPDGCSNAGQAVKNQTGARSLVWKIDSIFLTKDAIDENDFTAISVTEGDNKVMTDIRGDKTIKFNAPGLKNQSLNANNVTVNYCKEGTHDEATHNNGTLSANTDYTLGYEKDTLKLIFTDALRAGTTYNIHIGGNGFVGDLALRFNNYDLSFRTLAEGENIPPLVNLTNLTPNQRFFPAEGPITLTAEASDINGTVGKVEFYADETLLGEGTADAGVYTFVWENPVENVNGYNITAKAYDNDGDVTTSLAVPVLVLDYKTPEITLTAPTEDVVLGRNFAGVSIAPEVEVKANVNCIGSEPAEVEFILNENTVHSATNVATTYAYTFTDLLLGDNHVYVRVTDEFGIQNISNSVKVTVNDYGRVFPAAELVDFEEYAEGEAIGWTKVGSALELTATDYADNMVAKFISADAAASETVYTQLRYRTSLSGSSWEAAVRVNFADMNLERKVEVMGTEGLTLDFKTDGGVYAGSTKVADYRIGEWYDLKLIVDKAKATYTAMFDNTVVATKSGLKPAFSQSGATIRVSQNAVPGKTGTVLIDDAGIYHIAQTDNEVLGIKVYEGSSLVSDLTSVPLTADKISVNLSGTVDADSLKNNVYIRDTESGRKISTAYSGEYVLINEELKSDREYEVVVTTGVADVNGAAIAENGVFAFTTAKKDVAVASDATFSVPTLTDSVTSVTCDLDFSINAGSGHTAYVIGVVYDGTEMANIMVQEITVPDGTLTTNDITIPAYTAGTFVEVFVVDSLTNMKPISETIYSLR